MTLPRIWDREVKGNLEAFDGGMAILLMDIELEHKVSKALLLRVL